MPRPNRPVAVTARDRVRRRAFARGAALILGLCTVVFRFPVGADAVRPSPSAAPPPQRYTITDLGDAMGFRYRSVKPWAINNRGWVILDVCPGGPKTRSFEQMLHAPEGISRAVLWRNGRATNLGAFEPSGLNDRGEVVGHQTALRGHGLSVRAAYWHDGHLAWLRSRHQDWCAANAINDRGEIVGKDGFAACLWRRGVLQDLSAVPADQKSSWSNSVWSEATAVNARGQVVGWASSPSKDEIQGCAWRGGRWVSLTPAQEAVAINEGGQVLAKSLLPNGKLICFHSYVLQNGRTTPLDMSGYAINGWGWVVGLNSDGACLWDGQRMVSLSRQIPAHSGWRLQAATGVNDRGQIVGFGSHHGRQAAFLLTPVGT